jgi:hypothetical protein
MLHITIGVPGYCAGKSCAGPGALAPSARSARFGPRSGGYIESALAVASLAAKALRLAIGQSGKTAAWSVAKLALHHACSATGGARCTPHLWVVGFCCAGRALAGPPSCRFAHRKATWPWAGAWRWCRHRRWLRSIAHDTPIPGWITPPTNGVMRRLACGRLLYMPWHIVGCRPYRWANWALALHFRLMLIRLDS